MTARSQPVDAAPSRPAADASGGKLEIAYFVHDVGDPAVAKRVKMFIEAGAEPVVIGFNRGHGVPKSIAGAEVVDLGRTKDGKLLHRAWMVLRRCLLANGIRQHARHKDILMGRNLEGLALAVRARLGQTRTVYECLDLHRILLGSGLPSRIMHAVEAALLRRTDSIVVSSQAYERDYFAKKGISAPVILVENKVLSGNVVEAAQISRPLSGPPWTIGWFGMLRCRKTFDILSELAARSQGQVRIVIAGRPTPFVFDDFEDLVARSPNVEYLGPYKPSDLASLYGRCHFAWCIDFFEEGLNSKWLLPNRLYESLSFQCVPIALADVEVGNWLRREQVGIVIDTAEEVGAICDQMTETEYTILRQQVETMPRDRVIADKQQSVDLLRRIARE